MPSAAPLIFDLDDTLIESFPTYVRLHQQVAGEVGLAVPTREALVSYAQTWEATLAALWPGADLQPFLRRYDEICEAHPYPAIDGTVPALRALRARGHSLWIVTKRTRRRLPVRLGHAGIDAALFDGIFPAEDQPALKPDPSCFAPVWAALGDHDARAVYVGDRWEDRHAAERAGIRFVAVLTGPEVTRGFPGDLAAAHVVDSVAQLPERLSLLNRISTATL